jgi:branched-chain amino acid transport system permease protein
VTQRASVHAGYGARLAASVAAAPHRWINWTVAAAILVFLVLAPPLGLVSEFNLSQVGIRALWIGIAAASVVFLAAYAGMVSLAQAAIYGVAGFTYADLVVKAGWSEWPAIFAGIGVAVAVGLAVGVISSRTTGIYFLMLTLAVAVIAFYLYLQVEQLSGQTGLHLNRAPALVGGDTISHPTRLYYAALIVSAAVYAFIRYLVRTPFGIALQGVRDDAVRMRSLGYNVAVHRALAFAVGALIASLAGILSVFFNLQISPSSIDINQTIIVLAVAVVGGLMHLEGAWIGALVYAVLAEYTQPWAAHLPSALQKPLGSERYPTWLGLAFLVVVLVSPGGLMGMWHARVEALGRRLTRSRRLGRREPAPAAEGTSHS